MFSEGNVLNYVDNVQDFAASQYAESPYADRIRDEILKARQTLTLGDDEQGITYEERVAANSYVGVEAWRVASFKEGIPIENQGYGLFQIIPAHVYEVAKNLDWSKYRGVLSKSDIIKADGSINTKGILKAIYDPKKMFALQVLRFSETMKLVKAANPEAKQPTYKAPYLKHPQANRDLMLVMTAQLLIAFPEKAKTKDLLDINVLGLSKNFANGLLQFYVAAHIMGFKLEIPGIKAEEKQSCDVADFSWYAKGLEDGLRTCLKVQ